MVTCREDEDGARPRRAPVPRRTLQNLHSHRPQRVSHADDHEAHGLEKIREEETGQEQVVRGAVQEVVRALTQTQLLQRQVVLKWPQRREHSMSLLDATA